MKSIAQKIKESGIKKAKVAKMVGINPATLSRIISGSQSHVSKELESRIHKYLDSLNQHDNGNKQNHTTKHLKATLG